MVEGDSSNVVGFLRSNTIDAWRFAHFIREILNLAGVLHIQAKWVAKGANGKADELAKRGAAALQYFRGHFLPLLRLVIFDLLYHFGVYRFRYRFGIAIWIYCWYCDGIFWYSRAIFRLLLFLFFIYFIFLSEGNLFLLDLSLILILIYFVFYQNKKIFADDLVAPSVPRLVED